MANKFKFKLNGLLKLREFKEKQIKVELGNIVKEIQKTKEKINEFGEHIEEAYKSQESILSSPSSGELIKFYPYFIKGKNLAIQNEEEKLRHLEVQYKEKVKEMTTARGETKVIDKLKENEFNQYRKEKNKKDFEKLEDMRIISQGNRK